MTTRFIRVQGQTRFTRKWPFETRVIWQKGVTYYHRCRTRVSRLIFLLELVAFLPSPSSSYHHGSVLLIHREICAKVRACSLSESRKSRSFNISNKNCERTISRRLHMLYLITIHLITFVCTSYFHNYHILIKCSQIDNYWNNLVEAGNIYLFLVF